jgi:CMP-N,N'-diacetyllegionaminic acid synthase
MVCKKKYRDHVKILAIIPARGGSKSVPRKNIANVNGNPLISYTIKAALMADCLTDIVVSTDDTEIAEISKKFGAQIPFIRPLDLASDEAQSAPVIEHALYFMEKLKGIKYDAVLMLQPTSPLRTSQHIQESLELFNSQECDSVVSVVSVGGSHPLRMKRLVNNHLVNYVDQGFWNMQPRQSLPDVYIRNGAIYLISRESFLRQKQLIGDSCLGYIMNDSESTNIDTPIDLKIAELLLKEKS